MAAVISTATEFPTFKGRLAAAVGTLFERPAANTKER